MNTRLIALTFDDGPNPDTTPDILRVLAKYNAHATFFLIGRRVKQYPDLVKRIYNEGNEVANHSYTHPNLTKLDRQTAYKELYDCNAAIKELVGQTPVLCRPPGGDANRTVINLAGALGMRCVAWSMNIGDYEEPDADVVQHRVVQSAQSGEIVLLHDKVYSTIMCLDDMLHSLQLQGYRFVTVSQMMEDVPENASRKNVPSTWFKD